jgi:hypothetical protein
MCVASAEPIAPDSSSRSIRRASLYFFGCGQASADVVVGADKDSALVAAAAGGHHEALLCVLSDARFRASSFFQSTGEQAVRAAARCDFHSFEPHHCIELRLSGSPAAFRSLGDVRFGRFAIVGHLVEAGIRADLTVTLPDIFAPRVAPASGLPANWPAHPAGKRVAGF